MWQGGRGQDTPSGQMDQFSFSCPWRENAHFSINGWSVGGGDNCEGQLSLVLAGTIKFYELLNGPKPPLTYKPECL